MGILEMDVCKGCGTSFVAGSLGTARLSIKKQDEESGSYFYDHCDICVDCVKKIIEEDN